MSDNTPETQPKRPIGEENADMIGIVYVLHLVSVLMGIPAVIGLIVAYIYRGESPEWMQTHYTYQIQTFWKGMLYAVTGILLAPVVIGLLILLGAVVWWIVRNVKGLRALQRRQPINDPTNWGFGA